jgi:GNAT superfamily N-acetyltransferase
VPLTETHDRVAIADRLDALLAADPVRNTVLGTIRNDLAEPWAVLADDGPLAVRNSIRYPVALSTGWSAATITGLAPLLAPLPHLAVGGVVDVLDSLVDALARPPIARTEQRLFRLDELRPPSRVDGHAGRADGAQVPLLQEWLRGFIADTGMPDVLDNYAEEALAHGGVWLWFDPAGEPVSTAFRKPATAGSARIGPVYTPAERRGRGYGSAVTAAATQDVLDDGAIPVLFTDRANPTSNKIYAALGYTVVEDRAMVRFAD